ncbi:MAG: S-layer homology domain-containing protein, partial [Bacillota bacterium]
FSVPWRVPESIQDVKIRAKLRSGNSETAIVQAEKAFPYGTMLEYGLFDLDYVAQNYYRTYIEVHHKGNQPLENAELVISRIDAANVPHELKRVSISDATASLDMFIINEGFEILHRDLVESSSSIEVSIERDGKLLVKQTGKVEKIISAFDRELLDKATGVEIPYTALSMTSGWKGKIAAKVYPEEAAEKNSIVYVSSNPGVATVNDVGFISALTSGSATITAYAVPKVDVSMQTTDGYVISGNILDNLALEDCKSNSLTVTVMDESSDETTGVPAGDKEPIVPVTDKEPGPVDLNANSNTPVSITEKDYKVEFGQKAIAEILKGEQSGTLTVSVKALEATEKAQMYAISVKYKDAPVTSLKNADVEVSIPYTLKDNENPNAVVVYSVTDKGELKANPRGRYENGMVTFPTSDLTNFAIGYNQIVFTDINKPAGYADAVTFITARGIAEGTGENQFAPDKLMTRQEFAKVITLAYGFTWSGTKSAFPDVANSSWYEPYVGALYEAGIISGRGDGKFGTGQYITRQEMAKILYAALQKSGAALSKTRDYTGFDDDNAISKHTAPAIKALFEAGILSDAGNNMLAPNAGVQRSEMADIIKTALELN